MKKLLLMATLVAFAVFAKGQDGAQNNSSSSSGTLYHAFKFDIGVGLALPENNEGGSNIGAAFTLQPHVRLSDEFALGLRIQATLLKNQNNDSGEQSYNGLVSGCLSGEYYLAHKGFRPFIGVGAGAFTEEKASGISNNNNDNSSVTLSNRTTSFGIVPEAGFEVGHLRVSAEYDIVGNNNNYFAVNLGFFFGGGRK